jgi:hypothetical protein
MNRLLRNSTSVLKLFLIGIIFCYTVNLSAQESKSKEAQKVFSSFEDGLSKGAVDKFSNYFSEKNYLSLISGVTGYYSSNQSYYVLKDFLSIYQPLSFKLVNVVSETSTPFASGVFRFNSRGIRGSANVFISLQFSDNKWHISQITVN